MHEKSSTFVTNNENKHFIKQPMLQWLYCIPKEYNPMNINQIHFSIKVLKLILGPWKAIPDYRSWGCKSVF